MTEQATLDVDDGAEDAKEFRAKSADFTALPIVRQGMVWLRSFVAPIAMRPGFMHVDQCAGAGGFSVIARELKCSRTVGFEIRKSERPHLERNCDEVGIGDVLEFEMPPGPNAYITNPAFPELSELLTQAVESADRHDPIMYLGLSDWGQRGKNLIRLFKKYPPMEQARIADPISFRGKQLNPKTNKPYGSDMRSYSWWVWIADGEGGVFPSFHTKMVTLPSLPAADRKWKIRPGTETAS